MGRSLCYATIGMKHMLQQGLFLLLSEKKNHSRKTDSTYMSNINHFSPCCVQITEKHQLRWERVLFCSLRKDGLHHGSEVWLRDCEAAGKRAAFRRQREHEEGLPTKPQVWLRPVSLYSTAFHKVAPVGHHS